MYWWLIGLVLSRPTALKRGVRALKGVRVPDI